MPDAITIGNMLKQGSKDTDSPHSIQLAGGFNEPAKVPTQSVRAASSKLKERTNPTSVSVQSRLVRGQDSSSTMIYVKSY